MSFQKNMVMPGFFELYCGPMQSGKSRELISRVDKLSFRSDAEVIFFKPRTDSRDDLIHSRFGNLSYKCIFINGKEPKEIFSHLNESHKVVVIDEIMLFKPEIILVIEELVKRKMNVIAGGLDLDFKGEPFGPMPYLLAIADYVEKQYGTCSYQKCNELATRSQKLVNGEPASHNSETVSIEGSSEEETYECRCKEHHFVPGRI